MKKPFLVALVLALVPAAQAPAISSTISTVFSVAAVFWCLRSRP